MLTGIVLFIITIALIVITISSQLKKNQKERPFNEALNFFTNYNHGPCIQKFEELVFEDPYNALYHWYLARSKFYTKDYTGSIKHLTQILKINNYTVHSDNLPEIENFNEPDIYQMQLDIYRKLNLKKELKSTYQKMIQIYPEVFEYLFQYLALEIETQNYSPEVRINLEKAVDIQPENSELYFYLSLVSYKENNIENSLRYAEKAIHYKKSHSDAAFLIGYAHFYGDRFGEAIEYLKQSTMSNYFKKSAAYYLARIYEKKGEFKNTLIYSRQADETPLSIHENQALEAESKFLYALTLEKNGDYMEAFTTYEKVSAIKPDFPGLNDKLKLIRGNNDSSQKVKIVDLENSSTGDFYATVEKVIYLMGYKVKKSEPIDDKAINFHAVLKSDPDSKKYTAILVRRKSGIINSEQLNTIKLYLESCRLTQAVIITTGDFDPKTRKEMERAGYIYVNSQNLQTLLAKID